MDDAPHIGPDMRDLMATVGELLLFWGFLENAIRERMLPTEPSDPRNSKAPLLMRWREAEKAARADDSKLAKLVADPELHRPRPDVSFGKSMEQQRANDHLRYIGWWPSQHHHVGNDGC